MDRKILTRVEMWNAITSKYQSLKVFFIDYPYRAYSVYRSRKDLFNIIIEMKIHKSRHLTKKQKAKVQYELNLKVLDKI